MRIDASRLWWLRGSDRAAVGRILETKGGFAAPEDLHAALSGIDGLDPGTVTLVVESVTVD